MFNTWRRGTIDIAMILQENGLGLTPTGGDFFLFFSRFAFVFLV